MYRQFYQLKEHPFNVTADPDFFFSSKHHSQAFAGLMYGIEQRKGILVVTGEIGTGKTTLCRKLLKNAQENVKFALILNPKFSELQLLQMVVQDLGIRCKQRSKFGLIHSLNEFLLAESNLGKNIVIIVDEAQNLTVRQLEQIRLLSNLETEKEKLLQIVLVGQPELYEKLKLPNLRQLRQRIAIHFHLRPLEKEDMSGYINFRLAKALQHMEAKPLVNFTSQAIESIYQFSQGTPRTINMLCDRALLAGFVAETYSINEAIVENCAREVLYCEHHL